MVLLNFCGIPAYLRLSMPQIKIADFGACVILKQDGENREDDSSGADSGKHDGGERDQRKVTIRVNAACEQRSDRMTTQNSMSAALLSEWKHTTPDAVGYIIACEWWYPFCSLLLPLHDYQTSANKPSARCCTVSPNPKTPNSTEKSSANESAAPRASMPQSSSERAARQGYRSPAMFGLWA